MLIVIMKIAYCIRADWNDDGKKGGDGTQLLKTKANVEKCGPVQIEIITDANVLDRTFDIVHIFNFATTEISDAFINRARELKLKTVFSTIFWDYSYTYNYVSKILDSKLGAAIDVFLVRLLGKLVNKPRRLSNEFRKQVQKFIEYSDYILPNSIEEYYKICDFLQVPYSRYGSKCRVIVNAADEQENNYLPDDKFYEKYDLPSDPFVLSIGRIQPIKGQLRIVQALADTQIPIVFVGAKSDKSYFDTLRKEADKRGNVYFIDHVDNTEVCNFYKRALVHVLPSLRESPGLVSLEALLNGCKIVVADKKFCPYDTYFKGIATAIDPTDVRSVQNGIHQEIDQQRDMEAIQQMIKDKFSWEKAGKDTYAVYKELVG